MLCTSYICNYPCIPTNMHPDSQQCQVLDGEITCAFGASAANSGTFSKPQLVLNAGNGGMIQKNHYPLVNIQKTMENHRFK